MTFGERLTNLRKENGYRTRKEFADCLGIPETTLRNYEKNVREPGHTFLKKISEMFGISSDYLLGLQDDKERTDSYQLKKSEYQIIEKYNSLDDYGKETIRIALERESARTAELQKMNLHIKELEQHQAAVIEFDGHHDVPARFIQYYQKVSAGTGEVIYEDILPEQITIPAIPKYRRVAYAVKVSGQSMEPLYNDGDMLLIEPACMVDVGEIGIFNVDGKAYVKKRGETKLISLNKGYENIPLTNESWCMGRVVDKFVSE